MIKPSPPLFPPGGITTACQSDVSTLVMEFVGAGVWVCLCELIAVGESSGRPCQQPCLASCYPQSLKYGTGVCVCVCGGEQKGAQTVGVNVLKVLAS